MCVCVCCVVFTFTGQAMRCDPRQAIFTDVAEGGPCVGAGVPVVHPWEMFHIKLCRLTKEKLKQVGNAEKPVREEQAQSTRWEQSTHSHSQLVMGRHAARSPSLQAWCMSCFYLHCLMHREALCSITLLVRDLEQNMTVWLGKHKITSYNTS